jgi:hypothetical protein
VRDVHVLLFVAVCFSLPQNKKAADDAGLRLDDGLDLLDSLWL